MICFYVSFLFKKTKADTVNYETHEYVDEKHACSLLLAMNSGPVLLRSFQGVSLCCYIKPNNTMHLDFGGKTGF